MRSATPFVGPQPLSSQNRIYGRDRELRELTNLLITRRIVLLYSPSGAGKSSLLNAAGGLLDRLGRGSAQPLLDVRPATRVHATPPIGTASNRFAWSVLNGLGLAGLSQASQGSLAETISPTLQTSTLLVFDQFEEILRIDPTGSDARREFFRQLGELLMDTRIWALFALREDYLAPLDPYRLLVPTRLEERYRLDLLQREAAGDAARQTAASAGVTFADEAFQKLLDDLTLGGGPVEPLQLQLVCQELWQNLAPGATRIELEDVRRYGDVPSVLRKFYEDALAGAVGEDQYAVRTWIDKQLITPGATRGQVPEGSGVEAGVSDAVSARLVESHLLLREDRLGAPWLELAHDRLVEPVQSSNAAWFSKLSEWEQRVRNWAEEKNPDLRAGHLITGQALRQARRWFAQHPDSVVREYSPGYFAACAARQRQLYWKRAAIATLALLLVLVSIALVVVKHQEDLIRSAANSTQKSNDALTVQVSGLEQQHAALETEVQALKGVHAGLLENNAALSAESVRLVPQLKQLNLAGDGLLKQIHGLTFDQEQLLSQAAGQIQLNASAVKALFDQIQSNSDLNRKLHAANLQNRELMTQIIQLGIPLPALPPEIDLPVPRAFVSPMVAMVRPPDFEPTPDAYLKELLARNASLLNEWKQLGLANSGLAAEAAALRKQNDKLAAIQADLREQIAHLQDEVRLLNTVNKFRQDQAAGLTATNKILSTQLNTLQGTVDSISSFISPYLGYERADLLHWTDAVTAINKILSQAVQTSGTNRK